MFSCLALEAVELRGSASSLCQELAVFSVKGQVVNILGFAYTVSIRTTPLCQGHCINERGAWVYAAIDTVYTALPDLALV